MSEKKKKGFKNVELKLVSELLKNSRRSDRELAKTMGCSQPTVTRTRKRLEKEGYIGQYTLIPNFSKLGYEILAVTLVKTNQGTTAEQREKARESGKEIVEKSPYGIVMAERGMGLGYDGVVISYHKSYTEYSEFQNWIKQFGFLEVDNIESFLINLEDKIHFRPLSFTSLAHHLLIKEKEGMSHE